MQSPVFSKPGDGWATYTPLALVLIWLALSGSYNAWQTGPLLAMNGFIGLGLLAGVVWRFRPRALTWPLLAYWLVLAISTGLYHPAGWPRVFYLLVLIAVYHIPQRSAPSGQRSAVWAGWLVFPLIILLPWENGNSMAFVAWSLLWLGIEAGGLVWLGLGLLAVVASGSAGGLLAMLLGGAGYAWSRWRPDRLTTVSGLLVLAVLVFVLLAGQMSNSGSWDNRLLVYQHAGRGIVAAPLLGHGADAYQLTAGTWSALDEHNLALTILHETGLAGAVVAAWGLVWLVKRHEFAPWQVGFLTCFAGHSMVDGPLFASFFAGVVLMLVLGGLHKKSPRSSKGSEGFLG